MTAEIPAEIPAADTPVSPVAESENPAPAETPAAENAPAEDGFKSEASKASVLADLAREREERKRLQAIVDAAEREKMTELERAQAEIADLQKRARESEHARLRESISRTKGVDPDLLVGDTEEEMTAHADRLLSWRGDRPKPPTNPNPAQGAGQDYSGVSASDLIFNQALGRGPKN